MGLFVCNNCGDCCRDPASDAPHPGAATGGDMVLALNPVFLPVLYYEKDRIDERLGDAGMYLVPGEVIYDARSGTSIILQYTLPISSCPFLDARSLCDIYDIRPSVCRSFPAVMGPLDVEPSLRIKTSTCPIDITGDELKALFPLPITKGAVLTGLHERYGESFRTRMAHDLYMQKTGTCLMELAEAGFIEPYSGKDLHEKVKASNLVDAAVIIEKYLGMTQMDILNWIEQEIGRLMNGYRQPRQDPINPPRTKKPGGPRGKTAAGA